MINKSIVIQAQMIGDGTSTTFTLDLARDPYFVDAEQPGSSYELRNFSLERLLQSPPVGIANVSMNGSAANVSTASISGTVLTVTTVNAGQATGTLVADLLF